MKIGYNGNPDGNILIRDFRIEISNQIFLSFEIV